MSDESKVHLIYIVLQLYFSCFISKESKVALIYTVDPNTKSLNYMKIQLKALLYFELQQTSNKATSN